MTNVRYKRIFYAQKAEPNHVQHLLTIF